MNNSEP
jgi:serine/threonine protein kinase